MKFNISGRQFSLALVAPLLVVAIGVVFALSSGSWPAPASAKNKTQTDITFTKWVTIAPGYPMMAGFVGGDLDGSFSGEILARDATLGAGRLAQVDALYQVESGQNSFTAQVRVIQDNQKGTAVVVGVVTVGRLKGALVYGGYTIIECPTQANALNGRCFQGTLHLAGGALD